MIIGDVFHDSLRFKVLNSLLLATYYLLLLKHDKYNNFI